jgi:hypothetical protein
MYTISGKQKKLKKKMDIIIDIIKTGSEKYMEKAPGHVI